MTNPNVTILDMAWAQLWDSSSAYYLPTIMTKGGKFGTTTIPPLTTLDVPDQPSIPLYQSSTWGNVGITLSGLTVTGLPTIQNGSFTPSANASAVSATVAFGALTFAGNYEVDGTGLAGCAMTNAESNAYGPPPHGHVETIIVPGAPGEATTTSPPASNMALADQSRDQLIGLSSPNGIALVSSYYDHNDTINFILNDPNGNAFQLAWPTVPTGGITTKGYMQVTAEAAQNPGNPAYTVGGGTSNGYAAHAIYMQSTLNKVAINYAGSNPSSTNPFLLLALHSGDFANATQGPAQSSKTVDEVYGIVNTTTPPTLETLRSIPEAAWRREARERAERDYPKLEAQAKAQRAVAVGQATTYKSTGQFSITFSMPSLTFSGTVAVGGTPPDQTLTATLTSLSAAVPSVTINLLTGTDRNFTASAQSDINNATWFQKVIGTKINAQLGSASVLDYISTAFNQAINNIISEG